jgi:methyltransferase (TIGR00027 family)
VPRLSRWLLERGLPGAVGYFNARTRYFDHVLLEEARVGLEQRVILGAGFDSCPTRFSDALRTARAFEVDMPEVLALRAERLLPGHQTTTPAIAVPIDFEREDLGEALRRQGYASVRGRCYCGKGVTYYLPVEAVRAVLSFVASQSEPGSSILFDYVTKAYSGYAARRLADGWRRLDDVNRCGIDDIVAFALPFGLRVRVDIDAVNSSAVIFRCGLALASEHGAARA